MSIELHGVDLRDRYHAKLEQKEKKCWYVWFRKK